MRVGLLYKTVNKPYGGVNTFFDNFKKYAQRTNEINVMQDLKDVEIILTVGHRYGPDRKLKKPFLMNASRGRAIYNPLGLFTGKGSKKVVFRVDGLRKIYAQKTTEADETLIDNLYLADSVVFQSRFSQECFDRLEISYPDRNCIIYNGSNTDIFYPSKTVPDFSESIILITSSWSTNLKKGFETIARFSKLKGVIVLHVGRWPDEVASKEVRMLGTIGQKEVGQALRKGHFFLFPSELEACPNAVLEALACGLPVLYHNSGGTPELCSEGRFGMPIPSDTLDQEALGSFLDAAVNRQREMREAILENSRLFGFEHCLDQYIQHFERILS